jgi:hypothetical protein
MGDWIGIVVVDGGDGTVVNGTWTSKILFSLCNSVDPARGFEQKDQKKICRSTGVAVNTVG